MPEVKHSIPEKRERKDFAAGIENKNGADRPDRRSAPHAKTTARKSR